MNNDAIRFYLFGFYLRARAPGVSHGHFLTTSLLQTLLWEDVRVVAQLTIELIIIDYGAQFEICRTQITSNSKLGSLAHHHVPHVEGALISAELGFFV